MVAALDLTQVESPSDSTHFDAWYKLTQREKQLARRDIPSAYLDTAVAVFVASLRDLSVDSLFAQYIKVTSQGAAVDENFLAKLTDVFEGLPNQTQRAVTALRCRRKAEETHAQLSKGATLGVIELSSVLQGCHELSLTSENRDPLFADQVKAINDAFEAALSELKKNKLSHRLSRGCMRSTTMYLTRHVALGHSATARGFTNPQTLQRDKKSLKTCKRLTC